MMNATKNITRVTCRWDDQPGAQPGWYCETWDGRERIDDSQKVWFPIDVDDYDYDQADDLRAALTAAFPVAEIEFP